MNNVVKNSKMYKYISIWKSKKYKFDSDGNKFPKPEQHSDWAGKKQFVERLLDVEKYILSKKKNKQKSENYDCEICGEHMESKNYSYNGFVWNKYLSHYIQIHNIKPHDDFIDFIYNFKMIMRKQPITIDGSHVEIKNKKYVKVNRQQLLILDALLKHGGYTKKYGEKMSRYSEHAGLLDISNNGLEHMIVSGNTNRVDVGDDDIFLPNDFDKISKYEYLFHTHPATPKPGGRADMGILYEIPSIGDILHFIDNYNDGSIIGSIVITEEGLYLIKSVFDKKNKIEINEDALYSELKKKFRIIQNNAIKKYGIKFTNEYFYSEIAQDLTSINELNDILAKYNLIIDYFPRSKNQFGEWILDTIYLPIK